MRRYRAFGAMGFLVLSFTMVLTACGSQQQAESAGEGTAAVQPAASATPEDENTPGLPDPNWGFKQVLILALNTLPRDYEGLVGLMGDSFEVMIWYGNGEQMAPPDAVEALRSVFLPPENDNLAFFELYEIDADALFGGNPFLLYPVADDFLYSTGWGEDGRGEVLIYTGLKTDGMHYWQGILYASNGFAATGAPVADWVSLPEGICTDLRDSVSEALDGAEASLDNNVLFEDYVTGTSGTGCQILVTGTGVDFSGHMDVFEQLDVLLQQIGWTPDMTYRADGPTGTAGGYRRDSGLLLLTVMWEPAEEANCPQDQPISACNLDPDQMLYTITLSGAMQ
nr:hypothetical protein [Anaerolineae bacterium]